MSGTATLNYATHNIRWARACLTRYTENWRVVQELIEAGVVAVRLDKKMDTQSTVVRLILQNNRGHTIEVVEGGRAGSNEVALKNAIGPCILLNSLPPVD